MRVSVFYDHIREASRQKEKPEEEILRELYQAGARGLEIRLWDLLEDQDLYEKISREGFLISCIYEFYQMEKLDETEKMKDRLRQDPCSSGISGQECGGRVSPAGGYRR